MATQLIRGKEELASICSLLKVGDTKEVLLMGSALSEDEAALEAGKINRLRSDGHIWIDVDPDVESMIVDTKIRIRVSR